MTQTTLSNGELRYKGRKVDPTKFKAEGKDLRRLVGLCGCGKTLRGEAAVPQPDPYASDIYDDSTPVVQCADCHHESLMGI